MTALPVIDVSGLKSDKLSSRAEVAHHLGRASRDVGFFYASNHGIPESLCDAVFAASRTFFVLSAATKEEYSIKRPHRVAIPAQDRYSIAFFLDPNPDARVEVLQSCIAAGATAKYQPTNGAAYIQERLTATYDHLKNRA